MRFYAAFTRLIFFNCAAFGECSCCHKSQAICALSQNCALAPSAASNRNAVIEHVELTACDGPESLRAVFGCVHARDIR